jgi:hypothetical protein
MVGARPPGSVHLMTCACSSLSSMMATLCMMMSDVRCVALLIRCVCINSRYVPQVYVLLCLVPTLTSLRCALDSRNSLLGNGFP